MNGATNPRSVREGTCAWRNCSTDLACRTRPGAAGVGRPADARRQTAGHNQRSGASKVPRRIGESGVRFLDCHGRGVLLPMAGRGHKSSDTDARLINDLLNRADYAAEAWRGKVAGSLLARRLTLHHLRFLQAKANPVKVVAPTRICRTRSRTPSRSSATRWMVSDTTRLPSMQ